MTKADDILVSAYQHRLEEPPRVNWLAVSAKDKEYIMQLEYNGYIKSPFYSQDRGEWIVSFDFTSEGIERAKELMEQDMEE